MENSNVLNGNEIDQSKLPAFKVKVYGTGGEEIEKEEFDDLVDVRFWLPITYVTFVRLLMCAPSWQLLDEEGNVLTKGKNQRFNKTKSITSGSEIAKFAETITWAMGGAFTQVMEMKEEDLAESKPKYIRLIFDRISDTIFSYVDFELKYIEKPILVDGKRLFAPLVKTPVSAFVLNKGVDGLTTLRKSSYEKWERLLEDDDGENLFGKMVLDPLNMIKLGTQQAFMENFHNTITFNRWYAMPLINYTPVRYSNSKSDKGIFKKGCHDDKEKHTYSNNPNAANFYVFFIEKNELKMVKMDAKLYSHLNKTEANE